MPIQVKGVRRRWHKKWYLKPKEKQVFSLGKKKHSAVLEATRSSLWLKYRIREKMIN